MSSQKKRKKVVSTTTIGQKLYKQNKELRLNNAFRALFVCFVLAGEKGSNKSIISYALVAQCFINDEWFDVSVFLLLLEVRKIIKMILSLKANMKIAFANENLKAFCCQIYFVWKLKLPFYIRMLINIYD